MKKRFRCGRLTLSADGQLQPVDLRDGGGIRVCPWLHPRMSLTDVYRQLLRLYKIDRPDDDTALYDFKYERMGLNRHRTFAEYIHRNALHGNSTVVYIGTRQHDQQLSGVTGNVSIANVNHTHQGVGEVLPSTSASSSIESVVTSLMRDALQLIDADRSNARFIELYEKICVIHGYVIGMILPTEQSNGSVHVWSNFDRIDESFESTRALLWLNSTNARHMPLLSNVRSSFDQLDHMIQILRSREKSTVENVTPITRSSTTDEQQRSVREPMEKLWQKKSTKILSMLQSLGKQFEYLDPLARFSASSAFHQLIVSSMEKVHAVQATANLTERSSTSECINIIASLRKEFKTAFQQEHIVPSQSPADRELFDKCRMSLVILQQLLVALQDIRV